MYAIPQIPKRVNSPPYNCVKLQPPETSGKKIIVSGTFINYSRDEIKKIIENHQGINVSSISKKTTFVLAGKDMGPSKRKKAEMLDIPIISEEKFFKMLKK